MTIISNARADVSVIIIDQVRLSDESGLRELYEDIVREVASGETKNVVLDFELVDTIGSPGLQMLLRAKFKLEEKGAKLHLCGLRRNVAVVIRTTSFQQLFPVHDNIEAAQVAI